MTKVISRTVLKRADELRQQRIVIDGCTLVDCEGRQVRRAWDEIASTLNYEGYGEHGPMRLAKAVKEWRLLRENNKEIR